MARLVTLAKIRGLARLYADQRPGGSSAFVPDTDGAVPDVGSVNDLVNLAVAEFWDLLVAARGQDYGISAAALAIVANTSAYNLPSDFYEMKAVVLEWGPNDHESVFEIERVEDRPAFNNYMNWGEWSPKGYRLTATQIEFLPTPTIAVTGRLRYVPTAPILAVDTDTVDCVNGWEKLPALRVAMELRTVEEMPFGDLERLFDREKERIMEMASERQAATPKQVQDVQPEWGIWSFTGRRDP
jgi:hypothetical protein